jgi:hypothetical protein
LAYNCASARGDCSVDLMREEPYPVMPKQPTSVEIIEQGDKRVLLKTYADGTKECVPIVTEPPKKKRLSNKIAWYRDLKTGRRKFY